MPLLNFAVKKEGIGKYPQFQGVEIGCTRFLNFDLDMVVESHFDYRIKMSLIFDLIGFDA
jgi:hypothetical protein